MAYGDTPDLTSKFGAGGYRASASEIALFAQALFAPNFLSPHSQRLFLRGSDTYAAAGEGGSAYF